jgi:hypothetical protein
MTEGPLNTATAHRAARNALLLSIVVALTGNAFLGLCGALTCGLVLFFPRRSSATRDSADLIAGLSTLTAGLAAATAIIMLSSGLLILISSPQRFCCETHTPNLRGPSVPGSRRSDTCAADASTMVVQRLETLNGTAAGPGGRISIEADSGGLAVDADAARRLSYAAPRSFPADVGSNLTLTESEASPMVQKAASHTLYYLNLIKVRLAHHLFP